MQSDGLSIAGRSGGTDQLAAFVTDSNSCLRFRLIRTGQDLKKAIKEDKANADKKRGSEDEDDEDNTASSDMSWSMFPPEMTHQIYGEHENIFGYKGLKIDLWMAADTFKGYLRMTSKEAVTADQCEGVSPDPVIQPVVKIMAPDQVTENLDEFEAMISKADNSVAENKKQQAFEPFGSKVAEFQVEPKACSSSSSNGSSNGSGESKTFEIYQSTTSDQGFKDYHERLQFWIMFYIDAASYIDIDDDRWMFFTLFEKYKTSDGNDRYAFAGYTTVYRYFAYPENQRPRISQMLILPPFQKKGLGSKLLDSVCQSFWNRNKVVDITVEDPSDDFIRLRDFVDVQNALKRLDCFSCFEKVRTGFNSRMVDEAKDKMKLGKKQTRRVYEIIRLYWTKKAGPLSDNNIEYKNYRVDVKKRLNIPFQKEKNQMAKLKKALKPEEFAAATLTMTNREQRLESLQAQYNELLDHYKQILERIAASPT